MTDDKPHGLFASTSAFDSSSSTPMPPPLPKLVLSHSQQFKEIANLIEEAIDVLNPDVPELEPALSALEAALDLAKQHA